MSQSTPKPQRLFRGRLARTVLLFLLPISLMPVLLVGGLTTYFSFIQLRSQMTNQLSTIVEAQASQIADRVTSKEGFLEEILTPGTFTLNLDLALKIGFGQPGFSAARDGMLAEYERANRTDIERYFDHFMIVFPDTTIAVSTLQQWEGKQMRGNVPLEKLLGEPGSIAIYRSDPLTPNRLFILTSSPYIKDGKTAAVLVGVTEAFTSQRILETAQTIHPAARAYFYTESDGQFTGLSPSGTELAPLQISSEHLAALRPYLQDTIRSNFLTYNSFDNKAVIAFTKNIPIMDTSLIVELPQSVISAPIYALLPYVVGLVLVTLIILSILLLRGSQRLVNPLLSLAHATKQFAEGDWHIRASVQREDEIGLLAHSFNQMADELTNHYRAMETKVEERTKEMRAAAEVASMATSAHSLTELLQRTVGLIVDRFGYYDASVFLLDDASTHAVLTESAGVDGVRENVRSLHIPVGAQSLVGWVTKYNRSRVSSNVNEDPFYLPDESLKETQSEVVVPIAIGERLLGALDVQSTVLNAFGPEEVAVIQTLANQIATAIQNIRLLEATQVNLEEASLLYHASRQIARAEAREEIYQSVVHALQQTDYQSILLSMQDNCLNLISVYNPQDPLETTQKEWHPIPLGEVEALLPTGNPLLVDDMGNPPKIPANIFSILNGWNCASAAFVPITPAGTLAALIVLSTTEKDTLTPTSMQPFSNLAELTATALEKSEALKSMQRRLVEMETLMKIGETVNKQTDLYDVYGAVHDSVSKTMGVVNFYIAIYDSERELIHIPYMFEDNAVIHVDPFPLGQGLTSILIRSKQPLMLVHNLEEKLHELGAIVLGAPAKSWLGVPLLINDQVIGAVVVQDLDNEGRFDEEDKRLLIAAANYIAAAVRNARLLDYSRKQAERERLLQQVTQKVRSAIDMQSILATTASELTTTLGFQKATIEIIPRLAIHAPGFPDGNSSSGEAPDVKEGDS